MYRIERTEKHVIVLDEKGSEVYKGSLDGYIVFKYKEHIKVAQLRDLKDPDLLEALATAVRIKSSEAQ